MQSQFGVLIINESDVTFGQLDFDCHAGFFAYQVGTVNAGDYGHNLL